MSLFLVLALWAPVVMARTKCVRQTEASIEIGDNVLERTCRSVRSCSGKLVLEGCGERRLCFPVYFAVNDNTRACCDCQTAEMIQRRLEPLARNQDLTPGSSQAPACDVVTESVQRNRQQGPSWDWSWPGHCRFETEGTTGCAYGQSMPWRSPPVLSTPRLPEPGQALSERTR